MREIKFRGKKDNGEWICGSLQIYSDGECFINIDEDGWQVIPETIGQFTGLKDKSGKEMYEGDILNIWSTFYNQKVENAEVFWNEKTCKFDIKVRKGNYLPLIQRLNQCHYFCEVIGNIIDNPEFLGKEIRNDFLWQREHKT